MSAVPAPAPVFLRPEKTLTSEQLRLLGHAVLAEAERLGLLSPLEATDMRKGLP